MNRQRITRPGLALLGDQRGITGLETAIILIAFVVVASVFAFTVLSTGLFSSERGKEAVHAGLQEARGSPVLKGSLIAYKDGVDDDGSTATPTIDGVVRLSMALTNATAGEPVDLSPRITPDGVDCGDGDPPDEEKACYGGKRYTVNTNNVTVINYRDHRQRVEDLHWEVQWLGRCQESPCDNLLEVNETALITVWLHTQRDLDTGTTTDFRYVLEGQGGDTDAAHLGELLLKKTQFALEVVPPQGSVILVERMTPPVLEAVMNLK